MMKAYIRLEWDFLFFFKSIVVSQRLEFEFDSFKKKEISVLVNGSSYAFFISSRGLRQGSYLRLRQTQHLLSL